MVKQRTSIVYQWGKVLSTAWQNGIADLIRPQPRGMSLTATKPIPVIKSKLNSAILGY